MPRSVVTFTVRLLLTAALLAPTAYDAGAGDYWGAVSIAPDGIWGISVDQYTRSDAESGAQDGCRGKSGLPDQCFGRAVEADHSALAWFCPGEDETGGLAIITVVFGLEMDDHKTAMERYARDKGYEPGQCDAVVIVSGRFGMSIADGKKYGTY